MRKSDTRNKTANVVAFALELNISLVVVSSTFLQIYRIEIYRL